MSEERSAKDDAIRKSVVPAAEPLDDIILGDEDDGAHASAGPSDAQADVDPKKDRPSRRGDKKSRSKLALRIPDDEVARPEPKRPSVSPPPAIDTTRDDDGASALPPVSAQRIITIEPPPPGAESSSDAASTLQLPALDSAKMPADLAPPARTEPAHDEDSWTPFAPTTADGARDTEPPSDDWEDLGPPRSERPTQPPTSDEIPVDTDDDADPVAAAPIAPIAPSVVKVDESALPTMPRLSMSEEVKFEDDELPPPAPKPSETSELAADDVLAVDSIPARVAPSNPAPPPVPPMRAKAPSIPQAPPPPPAPVAAPPPVVIAPPPPAPVAAPPGPQPVHAPLTPAPAASPAAQKPLPPLPPQSAPSLAGPVAPAPPKPPPPAARPVVIPSIVSGVLAPPPMNDAAAARKRTRPWWEELFNDDFIRTSTKLTEKQIGRETTFIEESLGVATGAMILDLACGTGRHAIELTRRGYQVVGYDLSLAMLARAAEEAEERNVSLNFVQGDMRDMTFEDTFDGIYSWNTSFGFFEEEKNALVIARVHKALKKGGQFLLDVANRDYVGRQSPSLVWFEGDGCICMDEMQVDWITSRMRVKRTLMMDDGRTKEIEYSVRLYSLHELGKMLHEHGFRVAEVSGRIATPGVFFGPDSPRTIILAEKR